MTLFAVLMLDLLWSSPAFAQGLPTFHQLNPVVVVLNNAGYGMVGTVEEVTGLKVPNGSVLRIDPTRPDRGAEMVLIPETD